MRNEKVQELKKKIVRNKKKIKYFNLDIRNNKFDKSDCF